LFGTSLKVDDEAATEKFIKAGRRIMFVGLAILAVMTFELVLL